MARTFIGSHPDTEAFQKMILPDYLCVEPTGVLLNKAENIVELKTLTFSSYEILDPQIRQVSSTTVVIVGRVRFIATAGPHDISGETIFSTVWVKRHGQWLAQIHTETPGEIAAH